MAKIRVVITFVTAQAAKSTLTVDQQNISSVIELSDMTGMQGCNSLSKKSQMLSAEVLAK